MNFTTQEQEPLFVAKDFVKKIIEKLLTSLQPEQNLQNNDATPDEKN